MNKGMNWYGGKGRLRIGRGRSLGGRTLGGDKGMNWYGGKGRLRKGRGIGVKEVGHWEDRWENGLMLKWENK